MESKDSMKARPKQRLEKKEMMKMVVSEVNKTRYSSLIPYGGGLKLGLTLMESRDDPGVSSFLG